MEIVIEINSAFPKASAIRAELDGELHALRRPGLEVTSKTIPAPEGALLVHEVFQFLVTHKDEIVTLLPFLTACIQLTSTIVKRNAPPTGAKRPPKKPKKKASKKVGKTKEPPPPAVTMRVNADVLPLPAGEDREKRFILKVIGQATSPRTTTNAGVTTARRPKR